GSANKNRQAKGVRRIISMPRGTTPVRVHKKTGDTSMHDPQRRRLLAGLGATCAAAALPGNVRAAGWPDRPVNFIVPFPPGGPVDTTARFITQPLGELWKTATVVDNKAGA